MMNQNMGNQRHYTAASNGPNIDGNGRSTSNNRAAILQKQQEQMSNSPGRTSAPKMNNPGVPKPSGRSVGGHAQKQRAVSSTKRQGQFHQQANNVNFMNVQTVQNVHHMQDQPHGINRMLSAPSDRAKATIRQGGATKKVSLQQHDGTKPLFINKNFVTMQQKQGGQSGNGAGGVMTPQNNQTAVGPNGQVMNMRAFGQRNHSNATGGNSAFASKLNAQLQQQYLHDIDKAMVLGNLQPMTPQGNLKFRGGHQGVRIQTQQVPPGQHAYAGPLTTVAGKATQVGFFDNRRAQSNPRAAAGSGAYEMTEASGRVPQTAGKGQTTQQRSSSRPKRASDGATMQQHTDPRRYDTANPAPRPPTKPPQGPRYATIHHPGEAILSDGAANKMQDKGLGKKMDINRNGAPALNAPTASEQIQAPMSREEVQKLVFSNSNALMVSQDIIGEEQPAGGAKDTAANRMQHIKNTNIAIVNTNHRFLVDQNITASNMLSSHHQIDKRFGGRQTTGLIHVNDQSQEATDDNAASSQTRNDEGQLTAGDEHNFTHMSGALIVASGGSECTGGSMAYNEDPFVGKTQTRGLPEGEMQITTGAYSLHKTDDIILNESLYHDPPGAGPSGAHAQDFSGSASRNQNRNAILVQTNDINAAESENAQPAPANNSSGQSLSDNDLNLQNERRAGERQRARTNLRGAEPRAQYKTSQGKRPSAGGAGQNVNEMVTMTGDSRGAGQANQPEYGLQQLNNFLSNRQIGLNLDLSANDHQPAHQGLNQREAFARKGATPIRVASPNAGTGPMFFDRAGQLRNGTAQADPLTPQRITMQANRNVAVQHQDQKRGDGLKQHQLIQNYGTTGQRLEGQLLGQKQNQANRIQGKQGNQNAVSAKGNLSIKHKQNGQASQSRYNKSKTDMRRITTVSPTNVANYHHVGGAVATSDFTSVAQYSQSNQMQQNLSQMVHEGEDSVYSNQRALLTHLTSQVSSPMSYNQTPTANMMSAPKPGQNGQNARQGSRGRGSKGPSGVGPSAAGFSSLVTAKQTKGKDAYPSKMAGSKQHQTIAVTSAHPSRQGGTLGAQPPAQQPGYFYQKRQTQLTANRTVLSGDTLTPDVPALPDFHDPQDSGTIQGYSRDQRTGARNAGANGGRRAQSNIRNTQVHPNNKQNSKQKGKQNFRKGPGLQLQNMHAIDNYTDNHIFDVAGAKVPKTSTNAQTGQTSKATAQVAATGPGTRANSQAQQIFTQMSENSAAPRQQVLSALQNPTNLLAPLGPQPPGSNAHLSPLAAQNLHVQQQNSDIVDLDAIHNVRQRNNFFARADNNHAAGPGVSGPDGYTSNQQPANPKKLSKSIVVYHQMKKNLAQSQGVEKGSRYQHGMVSAMLSEENFEEHFNSLLLANSPGNAMSTDVHPRDIQGQGIGGQEGSKVERSVDGLTEALEDHLHNQNKRVDDPEKYHLRIKKAASDARGDSQQNTRSQHTAATSAGGAASGNYLNFGSRKLAPRPGGTLADSEAQAQQRRALSGILSSSINESNFENEKQKISNQNALLSLLSQDDFSQLKHQIHGKFIGSVAITGPIEEGVEDEDMDCLSQGVMSQGDECVTRVTTGGQNVNVAKAASGKPTK